MELSKKGADFIFQMEEEGKVALKAYRCQAGIWTIGKGHTTAAGPPQVVEGMEITEEDADIIFEHDMACVVSPINSMLAEAGVTVTQPQFDALVSFAFNEGPEALRTSIIWKRLCAGKPSVLVASAMGLWIKLRDPNTKEMVSHIDLADRRFREAFLFVTGIYNPQEQYQ